MESKGDDLASYAPVSRNKVPPLLTPKAPGLNPSAPTEQPMRRIKVEAQGDRSWKRIKPKIRLMGKWLERAGFAPGTHVEIRPLSTGRMELRSDVSALANNQKPGH